ncbi:MAG TPA: acyltransferase [Chryseolinea sp.]|nr:acyltransferase [Chryseolinea sp.]
MAGKRTLWIDHLRTFIILLVVAHHAALAYTTFSVFVPTAYILSTAPVVDNDRGFILDYLAGYNDIFFMPLIFFLSGLFVLPAIQRKNAGIFFKDRLRRLGIPFLVAVTVIIPVAYIPSYFLATGHSELSGFVKDYLSVQSWPVGPPWFIWVLLVFNLVGIVLYNVSNTQLGISTSAYKRPVVLFILGYVIACLALIPLSLHVGQNAWTGIGPFDFQFNRILFYLVFFLTGFWFGGTRWDDLLFNENKLLGLSWFVWLILSVLCYITLVVMITNDDGMSDVFLVTYNLVFVAACMFSCCWLLTVFRAKAEHPSPIMETLSSNAYGIYLVHYPFVTWLQFLLLNVSISAYFKFGIVFMGALLLSTATTHLLRTFPTFRRAV